MTVTKEQAQMLTSLAIACRPHRAPTWDEAGIMAQLAKMRDWQLSEVALRVIVCAADREAKTPAVIAAPGTRIPEVKPGPYQPKVWDPADTCTTCSLTRAACEARPRMGDDDHVFVSRARNAAETRRPVEVLERIVNGLREVKATEAPPEHVKPTPGTDGTEGVEAIRKALTPPHPVVGDQVEDQAAVAADRSA